MDLEKIDEFVLETLKTQGILFDLGALATKLNNPAIHQKDFQSQYLWQLVFFASNLSTIEKFVGENNPLSFSAPYFRISNPLMAAALGGNIPGMEYFIESLKAHVANNQISQQCFSDVIQAALFMAARSGSADAMSYLIQEGADPKKSEIDVQAGTKFSLVKCAEQSKDQNAIDFAKKVSKTQINPLQIIYNPFFKITAPQPEQRAVPTISS